MPPNPRDHLRHGQPVPVANVEEVVAAVLRRHFPTPTMAAVAACQNLAEEIVERLRYFRLLAQDVADGPDDRRQNWWDAR